MSQGKLLHVLRLMKATTTFKGGADYILWKVERHSGVRVEVSERNLEDYKAVVLHSVYIRFLLPLQVEVQCYEWADGFDSQRTA